MSPMLPLLLALFAQRYLPCGICFVVESLNDPAVAAIERVAREQARVPWHIVAAGVAEDCGQKVHNLIAATRAAQLPLY